MDTLIPHPPPSFQPHHCRWYYFGSITNTRTWMGIQNEGWVQWRSSIFIMYPCLCRQLLAYWKIVYWTRRYEENTARKKGNIWAGRYQWKTSVWGTTVEDIIKLEVKLNGKVLKRVTRAEGFNVLGTTLTFDREKQTWNSTIDVTGLVQHFWDK